MKKKTADRGWERLAKVVNCSFLGAWAKVLTLFCSINITENTGSIFWHKYSIVMHGIFMKNEIAILTKNYFTGSITKLSHYFRNINLTQLNYLHMAE